MASGAWLPAVMAGDTGIAFGTRLQSLVTVAGQPNELKGGKRPRVTLSPTLILKDGEPVYALSTPVPTIKTRHCCKSFST